MQGSIERVILVIGGTVLTFQKFDSDCFTYGRLHHVRVRQRALHNAPMYLSEASLPKHLLQDDLASWDLPLVYGELVAEWRPAKPCNSAAL